MVTNLNLHLSLKSARIRSYSGPYFPAFGLNTETYGVSLRIQAECGKMRTRITPNTDTFCAAHISMPTYKLIMELSNDGGTFIFNGFHLRSFTKTVYADN